MKRVLVIALVAPHTRRAIARRALRDWARIPRRRFDDGDLDLAAGDPYGGAAQLAQLLAGIIGRERRQPE
jgi:hypothetical protein